MSERRGIFISHPHSDERLAFATKELVRLVFGDAVSVFVSSDIANLPAGLIWREELQKQLVTADLLIVICSPDSATKDWLLFEVGGAWALKRPVIPLCHSGMRPSDLPSPLTGYNGLEVSSNDFGRKLAQSIGSHLRLAVSEGLDFSQLTVLLQREVEARRVHKFDLFVSCPMTALDESEYESLRGELVALCDDLMARQLVQSIYFSGYNKTTAVDFDHPRFGSQKDLAALQESSRFVLVYPKACPTGALVEAGFALSRRTPSVYYVRNGTELPFNLRGLDSGHGVQKHTYSAKGEIRDSLLRYWSQLFPETRR